MIFLESDQWDVALEMSQKMSLLEPSLLFPYEKRAEIYFTLGHAKETASEYIKAAGIAFDHNQKHRALELLYKAFKITPSDQNIWKRLRDLMIRIDPKDPLIEKLSRFLQPGKTEKDWSLKLQDARLLIEESLFLDAKKIYLEILAEDPQQEEAKQGLLELQNKLTPSVKTHDSPEEVLSALERDLDIRSKGVSVSTSIKVTPEPQDLSDEDTLDLAIAYKEMSLYSEAISLLKPVLKKSKGPHRLNALSILSLCLIENQQFFEAISLLENSLRGPSQGTLDHVWLSLLYILSQAYEKSGNASKALYVLRKIEHHQKNYRDIQDRIQRLRKHMAPNS